MYTVGVEVERDDKAEGKLCSKAEVKVEVSRSFFI
jgi:hypothetical protein